MGTPTIINGQEHFFNITYEGNGGGQRVGNFIPFTDSGVIPNSVIFNSADSAKLERTPSSNGSGTTFTISFWYKPTKIATSYSLFDNAPGGSAANIFSIIVNSDNTILIHGFDSGGSFSLNLATNRTFEDTSKFYHFLVAVDTTQGTSTNRVKFYVDGDQITSLSSTTYPGQNATYGTNQTSVKQAVGYYPHDGSRYADAYLAEFNLIDGSALTPSTFGLTDTSTGRWIPKALTGITYGTNGFRLQFGSSSALGDDTSGNNNDLSNTNLVASDQVTDSPTQNFATLTPNRMKSGFTLSEGNLKLVSNTTDGLCMSGMRVSGGKFYIETEVDAFTNGGSQGIGFCEETLSTSTDPSGTADVFGIFSNQTDFVFLRDGAYAQDNGGALVAGDILQIAFDGSDLGNAKFYLGINNSKWYYEDLSENSSFDATRPTLTLDLRARTNLRFYVGNRASTGSPGSSTYICNFGQKSYSYTAPTGFGSFNQDALPETGKGLSDFVWFKGRDTTYNHELYDSSRGVQLRLTASTDAELRIDDGLQKFLKGGSQIEDRPGLNTAASSYVSWNWVANSGTTASNSNGSITSTVQANTTAGFSIIQYTGTGSNATVGHGLSSAPEWMLFKNLDDGNEGWPVYHKNLTSAAYILALNNTNAQASTPTDFNSTAPTSTVLSVGTNARTNASSNNYIAYCWHGVEGFSKFGSYTGNGNTSGVGPFIYLGFKPSWLLVKNISSATGWILWDNKRNLFNPVNNYLIPNSTNAEASDDSQKVDFLSNGFKVKNTASSSSINASGSVYIYMAFAEHPFVGNGTNPVTAR